MATAPREARIPGYRRRTPEATLLHEVVREHLETFLAELDTRRGFGLPAFCKRELRRYLECGVLAHGFVRVSCGSCKRAAGVGSVAGSAGAGLRMTRRRG